MRTTGYRETFISSLSYAIINKKLGLCLLNYKKRIYGKTKQISTEELKRILNSPMFAYIKIALLFGSRASDSYGERSDYDFAFLMEDLGDESWGMLARAYADINSAFGLKECDYDIINLSSLSPSLSHTISKKHILLKGSQDELSEVLRNHQS